MGYVLGLRCKGCGKAFDKRPIAACEECWAALEPVYDMDAIRRTFTRESIASRPRDLWRYHELLPVDGEPTVGRGTGFGSPSREVDFAPVPKLHRGLRPLHRRNVRGLAVLATPVCEKTTEIPRRCDEAARI